MLKFKYIKVYFLFALLLVLSGCADGNNIQSYGDIGITPNYAREGITGKPYVVRGVTYHPLLSADGFIEVGEASWYGPGFHGKLTANGEVYNQNAMTAAHKYLPLGTYVYVQNLENGKMIHVKINDRGPFLHDRVIDLSKKGASELGLLEKGIGKVRVSVEKNPESTQVESQIESSNVSVQAPPVAKEALPFSHLVGGSTYIELRRYNNKNAAMQGVYVVNDLALPARIVQGSGNNFILQAGPFLDTAVANKVLPLFKIKFSEARVVK